MTDFNDDDRDIAAKGPDAFRTISEVAEELGLPQHVLRFWETRFPQVRPVKRGGGRRYYRPADVDLLRGVKQLLYGEGYTIRGVQRILREQGGRKLAQEAGAQGEGAPRPLPEAAAPGPEMWAPGRRVAAAEPLFDAIDPEPEDDAYLQPEDDAARHDPVAPKPASAPLERRPGLTGDQIARLLAAVEDLKACRRMLGGRSS